MKWSKPAPGDLGKWHAWFAWYPVQLQREQHSKTDTWVWLERVERREWASVGGGGWEFRQ